LCFLNSYGVNGTKIDEMYSVALTHSTFI